MSKDTLVAELREEIEAAQIEIVQEREKRQRAYARYEKCTRFRDEAERQREAAEARADSLATELAEMVRIKDDVVEQLAAAHESLSTLRDNCTEAARRTYASEARAEKAEREIERLRDCLRERPNTVLLAYEDGENERLVRAAGKAIERLDTAEARIAALEAALTEIKRLKSKPISDTGFSTGPLALLNAAQRIARDALVRAKP